MDKVGAIEIIISGRKGNLELTPDNYDIRELIEMLENIEGLIYLGDKRDRPTISYRVEEGSVRHIFKTSMQFIIGFNAILEEVNRLESIDFLDAKTDTAFENIQKTAIKKDYEFNIKTSIESSNEISINNTTKYYRTEIVWADAEFYFYGKVTNAGGKEKANIHLLTEDYGTITIDTPKRFLENYEDNLLYKTFGIRAKGKQHSGTGEIDKSTLTFVDLINYQPKYDEDYLKTLREKAKKNWLGAINPDEWLNEIRGGYDT